MSRRLVRGRGRTRSERSHFRMSTRGAELGGGGARGGREREYALRGAELGGAGLGGVCVWSCRRGRESKTQGDEGTYLSCTSRSQRSASCEVGDWGLGHGERRGRGASHGR